MHSLCVLMFAVMLALAYAGPLRGQQGNNSAIQVDGTVVGAKVTN